MRRARTLLFASAGAFAAAAFASCGDDSAPVITGTTLAPTTTEAEPTTTSAAPTTTLAEPDDGAPPGPDSDAE